MMKTVSLVFYWSSDVGESCAAVGWESAVWFVVVAFLRMFNR